MPMRLTDEEQAMRAGAFGEPRRWAIEHQIMVGEFFDAADLVSVSQAHIMADTESLGEAGVAISKLIRGLARPRRWRRSKLARSPRSRPSAS
jgi:predicted aconitase